MSPDLEVAAYECGRYLGASVVKLHIAEFHLVSLRKAIGLLTPEVDWARADPPTPTLLDVYGQADGCVLQLVGAFDAWACAAAWTLGRGDPDGSSLKKLANAPPQEIAVQLSGVSLDPHYKNLLTLRHLAAHRGVVGTKRALASHRPGELIIRTEKDDEVLPMLEELVGWARGALTSLHAFADQSGWRSTEFENAPHRLRPM